MYFNLLIVYQGANYIFLEIIYRRVIKKLANSKSTRKLISTSDSFIYCRTQQINHAYKHFKQNQTLQHSGTAELASTRSIITTRTRDQRSSPLIGSILRILYYSIHVDTNASTSEKIYVHIWLSSFI